MLDSRTIPYNKISMFCMIKCIHVSIWNVVWLISIMWLNLIVKLTSLIILYKVRKSICTCKKICWNIHEFSLETSYIYCIFILQIYFHSLSLTHTHTHARTHAHTHTHTHTHSFALSFSFCLSWKHAFCGHYTKLYEAIDQSELVQESRVMSLRYAAGHLN